MRYLCSKASNSYGFLDEGKSSFFNNSVFSYHRSQLPISNRNYERDKEIYAATSNALTTTGMEQYTREVSSDD